MKSKIISTTLLIIWLLLIFVFSQQPGEISESASDTFTYEIVKTATQITRQEIDEAKISEITINVRFLVRKSAHFFLYFILNILVYFVFKSYGIKYNFWYSIIFCALYACSDEIHQYFIVNRTSKVLDVFIDTCGALTSNLIILGIKALKNKKQI